MKGRIKEGGDLEGMRVRKRKTAAWSFGARETDRRLLIYTTAWSLEKERQTDVYSYIHCHLNIIRKGSEIGT